MAGTISADLSGLTILITGASSGLGAHFAEMAAGRGARVVVTARRRDKLEELVKGITAKGGEAHAVTIDVSDAASIRDGVAAAVKAAGPLHALINNSGVAPGRPLLAESAEEWDEVIATNLSGARHMAVEVARQMVEQKSGGTIINIASILGLRQGGHVTAYATSKAGLVQLTKQMALEWARYGIRVNAIAPGYIETPMTSAHFETEAGKQQLLRIPLRRLGQPHDLDGPVLLLLSPSSSFMTGSILVADGGHLISSL